MTKYIFLKVKNSTKMFVLSSDLFYYDIFSLATYYLLQCAPLMQFVVKWKFLWNCTEQKDVDNVLKFKLEY